MKCKDPCVITDPCGYNAECKVTRHNPICSCRPGYEGNPFVECKLIPEEPKEVTPRPPAVTPTPAGPTLLAISWGPGQCVTA